MAKYFKVDVFYNMASLGKGLNVYHFSLPEPVPTNAVIKTGVRDWLTAALTPLRSVSATSLTMLNARISEVNGAGVKVRNVGDITPTFTATYSSDILPLPASGSCLFRTDVPKVHGSKRIPGLAEGTTSGALFSNITMTAMAGYVLALLLGPNGFGLPGAVAGVISSAIVDFVPFNGSGQTTNVVGTQVTRKPLRGL